MMNADVQAMKRSRKYYAALFAAGILFTAYFMFVMQRTAAAVCGVLAVAAMVLLWRKSRLIYWAKVICDSKLLIVPTSVVTGHGGDHQRSETIVGTFGLLLGSQVYTWGCDGHHGVRLREVEIDGTRLRLRFGTDDELLCVEMLHGMTDVISVREFAEKIHYDTGVHAQITDW